MTQFDWDVYTTTLQAAVVTTEETPISIWVEAAAFHAKLYNKIHNNCEFLFWHRLFITDVERKLQLINPLFFWPIWNEGICALINIGLDHNVIETSPHWAFTGTSGMPVPDGLFAYRNLSSTSFDASQSFSSSDYKSLNAGTGTWNFLVRNFTMDDLNNALPGNELFATFFDKSTKEGELYSSLTYKFNVFIYLSLYYKNFKINC